jgi:hypothetical protein
VKRPLPLAALLTVVLALAYSFVWLYLPSTVPLAPVRQVVVLLVPGLSATDLTDTQELPALGSLIAHGATGLARTQPRESFPTACRRIGRVIAVSQKRLRAGKVASFLLGNADAIPLIGADVRVLPDSNWQTSDPDAATGRRTDVTGFTRTTLSLCRSPETSQVITVYPDLDHAQQYARFALPEVTARQRSDALHRLNAIVETLTSDNGLSADTALIIAVPTSREGQHIGPVVYWRRTGATGGLLLREQPGSEPGLVSYKALFTEIANQLTASNPSQNGRQGICIATGSGAELLQRAPLFNVRQQSRRHLPFFVVLLLFAGIAALALFRLQRVRALRAAVCAILATPLLLHLAGIAPLSATTTGAIYVLAFLGCVAVFGIAYLLPEKMTSSLFDICLITVMVVLADRGAGLWLASCSPLAERTTGRVLGPVEGMVVGSALISLQATVPGVWQGRRWFLPLVWAVTGILLFVFGGIATASLCLLYSIGPISGGQPVSAKEAR